MSSLFKDRKRSHIFVRNAQQLQKKNSLNRICTKRSTISPKRFPIFDNYTLSKVDVGSFSLFGLINETLF
jgi:hypothetical protein